MDKVYLVDGMSLVFRAYHAMSKQGLSTSAGLASGAMFGFANMMNSLIDREKPKWMAVVFDTHEPTFRHIRFEEYKAHRVEFPEDLGHQVEWIKKYLDLTGIPRIEKHGFEADDIVGTLACQATEKKIECYCITSDKDYYQLINDYVKLLKPDRFSPEFEKVDYDGVLKKFGVTPDKVVEVLALIGDASDNVPGVKGIGDKTAIPLIQKYGSIENLYERLDELSSKSVKEKLLTNKENAFLSKELVTLDCKTPLDFSIEDCVMRTPKWEELDKFLLELEFRGLRKKWADKAGKNIESAPVHEPEVPEESKLQNINDIKKKYFLIKTEEELIRETKALADKEFFAFDIETSSLNKMDCCVVGLSFACDEGRAFYVSTFDDSSIYDTELKLGLNNLFSQGHIVEGLMDGQLLLSRVLEIIKPLLENEKVGKCGQNIKFDINILRKYGINVTPIVFDSMLASYLLNPDNEHNMKALSKLWLSYDVVPIEDLIGAQKKTQRSMKELKPEEIFEYACEDADVALKLRNKLYPELEKEKLLKLAEEIEFPLVEVLSRMEMNGIAIDRKALADISVELKEKAKNLQTEIYKEAGSDFNIDSPKQLGHVLYEKMNIPPVKKTKTGFSTDVQALSQLACDHPICDMILEYRGLVKLKSTYVDALPLLVDKRTGRIHTTYNQTIASTGRLSSTDPNLQNIPIRTDMGKEIRRAFIPGNPGATILSADYSQIELRIIAHISGDVNLISAFKNKMDIHTATSSLLFKVPLDEVSSDMRRIAKTVNFGILYGLGAFGMAQRLNMGRREAQEIIDNYFKSYPGIRSYMESTIAFARKNGYTETLCGRRRYFRDINHNNKQLAAAAERAAINMPIQGTASDMMKLAMIEIDKEMRKLGMKSIMMLQVHDELVFEALPGEENELRDMVVEKMEKALLLGETPVVVESGFGKNWLEAH